jgi:UDP-glucuronate 4-epimerase
MKRVLLTGCAGFIGFHTAQQLLHDGYSVVGIDNLNHFYDEGLKSARLEILRQIKDFDFIQADITDLSAVANVFELQDFDQVVHLAAQAGVRYSLENPHVYIQTNLAGFVNLLEQARKNNIVHFLFASSSSVYGTNPNIPFSEGDNVDHPISLYAATKKSNELIAHVYAHLYRLPVTGLRFFTVYGPWGRPDMAIFKFCKAIFAGAPITVYNHGHMQRDFTYVDDIVQGIVRILQAPPGPLAGNNDSNISPYYRIYNIGHNQPVELLTLIRLLEEKIGKKANIEMLEMQPGDVPVTYADINRLATQFGYTPQISIEEGISRFVDWYRAYFKPA